MVSHVDGAGREHRLEIRHLGISDYEDVWRAMDQFTTKRQRQKERSVDQCWLTEHRPVYTLGRRASIKDLKTNPRHIPVLDTDRGGGITWHGPGQIIVYLLLDIRRRGWGPGRLVALVEDAVLLFLGGLGLKGHRRAAMPGIYVAHAKIASLGFRIRHGCCYHGLSFNHKPDLQHFARIHTCGYADLPVTSLQELGVDLPQTECEQGLVQAITKTMCYNLNTHEGVATTDC